MDEAGRAGRRLLGFGLAGAACFFLAAAFAFAARSAPSLPLGRYRLQLLDRDCAGLALVSALAGMALLVSMAFAAGRWQKHRRATSAGRWLALAAVAFLPMFGLALAAWPSPPIRLSLLPADPSGIVGYRVWVRGLKAGPYPLRAYGTPFLIEAAERPGLPLTCAIDQSVEFGPLGWARFASVAASGEDGRLAEAVADPPDSCRPGIDLSQVTTDRRAQQLLEPFVLKGRVDIDSSDADAAEGRPVCGLPRGSGRPRPGRSARTGVGRRPGGVDPAALGIRDDSAWKTRLGPIESLEGVDRRVAISKPLADAACVELFDYYRKLPP